MTRMTRIEHLSELTERERAVVVARFKGESLRSIAARLGIGVKTVWEYQDRAVKKLGAKKLRGARRHLRLLIVRSVTG